MIKQISEHTARYWASNRWSIKTGDIAADTDEPESGRPRDHLSPPHTAWAERDHPWAGHPALQDSAGNCNM